MTVYVVDASVVMQFVLNEVYTPNVKVLFSRLKLNDRFVIPDFALIECTNVVWKQVQFHGMQPKQAHSLLKALYAIPFKRTPIKRLLQPAFIIGITHQLAVYDSVYIALAHSLKCPLITVDQKQARAAGAEGVILKAVTDFKDES